MCPGTLLDRIAWTLCIIFTGLHQKSGHFTDQDRFPKDAHNRDVLLYLAITDQIAIIQDYKDNNIMKDNGDHHTTALAS